MKKIMFNSKYGLDKAVMEGRKTMTRRIIPRRLLASYQFKLDVTPGYEKEFFLERSPYKVGEVIAIAMNYNHVFYELHCGLPEDIGISPGWTNKMFVRADLMPYAIKITNVKVERLQDITSEDCLREGIIKNMSYSSVYIYLEYVKMASGITTLFKCNHNSPREAFAGLIDSVSGKGAWESNPWVWVYEFELTDNPNKS